MTFGFKRRSGLHIGLAVTSGIIALLATLLLLLTTGPGEAFLRTYLERRLAAEFDREVSIYGLETNLFSRFHITGLSVHKVENGTEAPALTIGSVRVRYTLGGLIRRRFTIENVDVENLHITVKKDSAGNYNFSFLNAGPETDSLARQPSRFRVVLGSARLTGGEVHFEDRSAVNLNVVGRGIVVEARKTGDTEYGFEAAADSCRIRYADTPTTVTAISIKGLWDGEWLTIDSLGLRLPGVEMAGYLGVRPAGGPGSLRGHINVAGIVSPLAEGIIQAVADTTLSVSGYLDLGLDLAGSLEEPIADLTLDLTDLAVDDFRAPHLHITATAEPESIRVNNLTLETLGGKISARGSVRLDSLLSFQSVVLIHDIELRRVLELARSDTLLPEGVVGGALRASGEIREPLSLATVGDVSVTRLRYRGKPIPDISVGISFQEKQVRLSLKQGSSVVTLQASVGSDRLDGRFAVEIPELEHLAGLFVPDLSGRVDARGRLGETLDSPSVDVEIDSVRVVYKNFPLDDLRGRLRYSEGEVFLTGLAFRGRLAEIDTLKPPFDLAELEGGFGYEGFVEGPVESPSGWVRAHASRLAYGSFGIDTLALAVGIMRTDLVLEDLDLRRDSLVVRGSGLYSIRESSGEFEVNFYEVISPREAPDTVQGPDTLVLEEAPVQQIQIGSAAATFDLSDRESIQARIIGRGIEVGPLARSLAGTPAGGDLTFSLRLSGALAHPDVEAEFGLVRPAFEAVEVDSVLGRMVLAGDELRIERLEAYYGPTRNHVTAVLALDRKAGGGYTATEQSRFQGTARADRLDLRLINPLLPEGMQAEGYLSYDLEWDGTLRAPRPRGRLAVKGASVKAADGDAGVRSVSMDVALADTLITVDKLTGLAGDTPFELRAEILTSDWHDFGVDMRLALATYGEVTGCGRLSAQAIDFEAVADGVNLDVVGALSPSVTRVEGVLNGRVRVTGTPAFPRIRGGVKVRGLYLESPEFSPPLEGGSALVDFEGNVIRIDSLFVKMGEGYVFVSGLLSHAEGALADVAIGADVQNVNMELPGVAHVRVQTAKLEYTGAGGKYVLDGDVVMGDTRFVANFDPRSLLSFAGSVRQPQQEMPPFLANTVLDVRLRDSKDLWIDNNVARVRSHAELNLVGTVSQPNVTGRVTVTEGYVMFLDRKFEMETGVLDFIERDRLNPIIEMRAHSDVKVYRALKTQSYTVYLDITGPLDQVKVALTSDPQLDRSNILSLLTIGVTRDQLAGSGVDGEGTTTGEALKVRAEELTSKFVSGYVSRNIADMFGLKDLSIEGNLFGSRHAEGPRLVASRGLSGRVDVTYSTNIGDFNENRVRLDYRLSERFLLQGETDQQGKAAIDLKYRVRFR